MARFWLTLTVWGVASIYSVRSTFVTPILPLSFLFDWNDPTAPFPVPVTEQCETIHIKWSRSSATGPNPTAPYYLQVYTSNFIQPFIIPAGNNLSFDWAVPFAPGTLYQICMFDKFGNTGGCQDKYTVIAPSTPTTCANVTFAPQLNVLATVDNGPMSQFGFVDQCTDISLTPMGGTPPFTLTVAPSLHPPYNITSFDMKPINWTVSLNWAMPFFISLADSNGSLWSNGPLHAGSGGSIQCLAGNATHSQHVRMHVAVGASVAGMFLGAVLAGIGLYFLSRRHSRRFEKLSGSEKVPVSRWTEFIVPPSTVPERPQLNPFQISARSRPQVFGRKLQIPAATMIHETRTERPPSYPEYSPAESEYLSTHIGLGRSMSTPSSTGSGASIASYSPSEANERHYDPRGPLKLSRPRRLTDVG